MAKRSKIDPQPGETVLLGTRGAAKPNEWWVGKVLWASADEVLVEQYGLGGNDPHRQLHSMATVRAVGAVKALVRYQNAAVEALKPLIDTIRDLEAALQEARREMYAKLDEIDAGAARIPEASP